MALIHDLEGAHALVYNRLVAQAATLGVAIADIYDCDQARLPRTPSICVEPNIMSADLIGASSVGRLTQQYEVYVLAYSLKISTNIENTINALTVAEKVRTVLHSDPLNLGTGAQQVVLSYVSRIEMGVANKGELLRAARVTWLCQTVNNI